VRALGASASRLLRVDARAAEATPASETVKPS